MKRINALLLSLAFIASFISFTSCGDDDDDNFNASDIVGKWKEAGEESSDCYLVYTFTSDGRCNDREYFKDGTPAEPEGEWTKYAIKDNMLYVTYEEGNKDWDENGDNTEKARIIKLTKTELELQWEDIDIDGNLIFEDEVLTFQRITE